MTTFFEFRETLEKTIRSLTESSVSSFTVGKDKLKAEIKKGSNGKFIAYIDGVEMDEFKTEKEARKGIDDFVALMDM